MSGSPQSEPNLLAGKAQEPDTRNSLVQAIESTVREFHENRDFYFLQKRCEALSQLLAGNRQGQETVQWIATQAELIDCRLVADTPEELEDLLRQLALRVL